MAIGKGQETLVGAKYTKCESVRQRMRLRWVGSRVRGNAVSAVVGDDKLMCLGEFEKRERETCMGSGSRGWENDTMEEREAVGRRAGVLCTDEP